MRSMRRSPSVSVILVPLLATAAVTLSACSKSPEPAAQPSGGAAVEARATSTGSSATASATTSTDAGGKGTAHAVKASNDLYEFTYSWPGAAEAIPALRDQLARDEASARSKLEAAAKAGQTDARQHGYPFHPFGHWQEWQVVTNLPGWLSLSSLVGDDRGGAHPNYGYQAILWDKQAGLRRDVMDLFIARAALSGAIHQPFCDELKRQRAKKRGGVASMGGDSGFDACIDPLAQTVILGSSNGRTFDRMGFLIAPYEAGPYAEGSYEVTLPVTQRLIETIKPEWRGAFSAK